MIYKCSNCDSVISIDDLFCSNCGGAVLKNYIGAKVKADVTNINKVDMIQYIEVIKINQNELDLANKFVNAFPELTIEYKENIHLSYKDNYVLKIVGSKLYFILTKKDKQLYKESPIFANQLNKNQVWWSTPYSEENNSIYNELIRNRIENI